MNVSGQFHVLDASTLKSLIILKRRLISCQSRSRRFEFEKTTLLLPRIEELFLGYLASKLVKWGNQVFLIKMHFPSLKLTSLFKSHKVTVFGRIELTRFWIFEESWCRCVVHCYWMGREQPCHSFPLTERYFYCYSEVADMGSADVTQNEWGSDQWAGVDLWQVETLYFYLEFSTSVEGSFHTSSLNSLWNDLLSQLVVRRWHLAFSDFSYYKIQVTSSVFGWPLPTGKDVNILLLSAKDYTI